MGWASGSRLASELIEALAEVVDDDEVRQAYYSKMIEIFEDYDCDTLDECCGFDPAFDEAWDEYTEVDATDWSEEE